MPGGALAAPLIGAGSSLIGGILGNKAQSNANKANQQAQSQALAYEREKDAKAEARYKEDKARYEFAQQQAWKMKQGVLSRYGIHLPDMPQFQGGGGPPGAVPRAPVTLGAIARAVPPQSAGMPAPMAPDGSQALPPGVGPQGPAQGPSEDPFDWARWGNAAV